MVSSQYSLRDAGPGLGLLTGAICLSGVLYLHLGGSTVQSSVPGWEGINTGLLGNWELISGGAVWRADGILQIKSLPSDGQCW